MKDWIVRLNRTETWLALLIGAVALSRWFGQISILNNFDAVNYALALEKFDVRLHQTQPPGYYLYIAGARLVQQFWHDPLQALTIFSLLASALGVLLVFLTGRAIFNARAALIAAALLAVSTTFWFQGEIAAPYTGDLALSALVAWLCYRSRNGSQRDLWFAALSLGIAGAYRPQSFFFLAPLLLYALWGHPLKSWFIAGLISTFTAAVLFAPAIIDSGGLRAYLGAVFNVAGTTTTTHQASYGSWRYLGYVITTLKISFLAVGEILWIFVLIGLWASRRERAENLFLVLWVIPTWMVFCLLYPGNPGTILVCVTPFFLWAGRGFDILLEKERWRVFGWVVLALVISWQIVLFAWLPYNFLPYRTLDNAAMLKLTEEFFTTKLDLMADLTPENTLVIADNFRHLQYYLPEFTTCARPVLSADPAVIAKLTCVIAGQTEVMQDVPANQILPENTLTSVYFDIDPEFVPASQPWIQTRAKGEFSIWVMPVPPQQQAVWTAEGLIFAP